jgi:hypothetical protein
MDYGSSWSSSAASPFVAILWPAAHIAVGPLRYLQRHYQRDVSQWTSIVVLTGFPKPRVAGSISAGGTDPHGGPRTGTRKTGWMLAAVPDLISATTDCITALRSGSASSHGARSMSPTSSASSEGYGMLG